MFVIRPNPLPPFRVLYNPPPGTWLINNVGPRGSGKSHEASKYAIIKVLCNSKRVALLRDEQSTIQQSIMHEIKMRFDEINTKSGGHYADIWDMQNIELKNKRTGVAHVFNKGFKTSNKSKKANLKSISDVDIALIEEFEDIADEEKFNTFADSIRKEGAIILINSNVPNKNHWFVKRYYNLQEYVHLADPDNPDFKGYYTLLPKNFPGVVYIHSTYKDNTHLPLATVARYEAYGDPDSPNYNPEHYCTDVLGLVAEGAKGRIYPGWKPVSNALFESMPYPSYYGLDFGYSSDPVALVEIKSHNRRNFWRELIYEPGLTDDMLAAKMKAAGIGKAPVYADSAEPKSIDTLKKYGLNVLPADKGPDSVQFGIKHIKGMENFYVETSKNLIHENEEYRWELDANKEPTDIPEDKNNHLKDAGRYAIVTHKGLLKVNVSGVGVLQQGHEERASKLDWLK